MFLEKEDMELAVGSIGGFIEVVGIEEDAAEDLLLSLSFSLLSLELSLKWTAANINLEKLIPFPENDVGLDESSGVPLGLLL